MTTKREPRVGDVWRGRSGVPFTLLRMVSSGFVWTVRAGHEYVTMDPRELGWTLVTPAPEQPEAPREPADWRDAYPVGMRVEVEDGGRWVPGTVRALVDGSWWVDVNRDDGVNAQSGGWMCERSGIRPLRTEPAQAVAHVVQVPGCNLVPAPPACPFCSHALHTAHTSSVLRCAACGWAGTAEQRAAACEPVRPEPRFSVGQWVRPRDTATSRGGARLHASIALQVMAVDGTAVHAVIPDMIGAPEERHELDEADLVLAEREFPR